MYLKAAVRLCESVVKGSVWSDQFRFSTVDHRSSRCDSTALGQDAEEIHHRRLFSSANGR